MAFPETVAPDGALEPARSTRQRTKSLVLSECWGGLIDAAAGSRGAGWFSKPVFLSKTPWDVYPCIVLTQTPKV